MPGHLGEYPQVFEHQIPQVNTAQQNVIAYEVFPDDNLAQCVHRINSKFQEMKDEITNIEVNAGNAEQIMERFKA